MIKKDLYKKGLYDILQYGQEEVKEQIIKMLLIFSSFKQNEFKSQNDIKQIIEETSIYQLLIDNFEYKKQGLNESLVRDI